MRLVLLATPLMQLWKFDAQDVALSDFFFCDFSAKPQVCEMLTRLVDHVLTCCLAPFLSIQHTTQVLP